MQNLLFCYVGVIVIGKREKGGNAIAAVTALAQPLCEQLGLSLWDVRFEKEGTLWYLRVVIDRLDGVLDIADCENLSRALSDKLDEADPIEQSYILEVSSPGIERELLRDWHFEQSIGKMVHVRLIRAIDGVRDFDGQLISFAGNLVTIQLEDGANLSFKKNDASFVKLFDMGGQEE